MEWSPRLLAMESELEGVLSGNDQLVHTVAQCIRKRLALGPHHLLLGSFLVVGDSEVVRLAEALAAFLFGNAGSLLVLDMKDYTHKYDAVRLTGFNGGLVCDYWEGTLIEPIRKNSQAIIVCRNIEYAHPDVLSLMVSIMEDGDFLDVAGRITSFKESILVMTTKVGFTSSKAMTEQCRLALQSHFPSELLERLNEIVFA